MSTDSCRYSLRKVMDWNWTLGSLLTTQFRIEPTFRGNTPVGMQPFANKTLREKIKELTNLASLSVMFWLLITDTGSRSNACFLRIWK